MTGTSPERGNETPDAIRRLRELGLSEYAARAYAAALKLGRADAKSISTLARVPPSKVYEVLGTLEENGLLEVFPEFPKKYGAVSLAPYLDRLHRKHENMARRIEQERDDLLRTFSPHGGEAESNAGGDVLVVRGGARVQEGIQRVLREARSSLLVLGSTGTLPRYSSFMDDVRVAHERGVHLRFLLPESVRENRNLEGLSRFAEIRAREHDGATSARNVSITIADETRALLAHWAASDGVAPGAADVAVLTDEKGLVVTLRSLVEAQWQSAAELKV